MTEYKTQRPYASAYVILRDKEKIAFVLRGHTGWMDQHYGLPSGKVENNESYLEASIREVKEEVGITIQKDDLVLAMTMHRHEPTEHMDWVDLFFETKAWQGEPFNAEPHKHSKFAWLDADDLPANVVPNVRVAIEQIALGKTYSEFNWQGDAYNDL